MNNFRSKIKKWVTMNCSKEFIDDMIYYHDIDVEKIVNFIEEAKIENYFKQNINDVSIEMVVQSDRNFVLNTGTSVNRFWFQFVDLETKRILFEKDIGLAKRKW